MWTVIFFSGVFLGTLFGMMLMCVISIDRDRVRRHE